MEYYTYIHIKDNQPIYVGKGKNNRAYTKRDYDNHTVKIIDKNISEAQALELEEFLIQEIGIHKLKNKYTKGGRGSSLKVNYKNFNKYKKTLKSTKEILAVAEQIITDACNGNIMAIKLCFNAVDNKYTQVSNDKLMTKILKGRVAASTNLLKQQLTKRFI